MITHRIYHAIFLVTLFVAPILLAACAPATTTVPAPANGLPIYQTATPKPAITQPAPLTVGNTLTVTDGARYAAITYEEGGVWKCITLSTDCGYSSQNGNLVFSWADNPLSKIAIAHTTADLGQLHLESDWYTLPIPLTFFTPPPKLTVGEPIKITDGTRYNILILTDPNTKHGTWDCVTNGMYCYSTPTAFNAFLTFFWENKGERVEFARTGGEIGQLDLLPGWYVIKDSP